VVSSSHRIADRRIEATASARLLPRSQLRVAPLVYWHLLSLDAPTVAAVWTWWIARSFGVSLPWRVPAAMFTAVWMLYATDRLLDARRSAPEDLEARHLFHREHRRWFLAGLALAAIALVPLLRGFRTTTLLLDLALGGLLLAWFAAIHLLQPAGSRRLPKEFAVGAFFASALFVPTLARAPQPLWPALPAALLLALLCTLNCLHIFAWEHPRPIQRTAAHASTRVTLRVLRPLTLAVVAAGLAVMLWQPALWPLPGSIALAALLLLALDRLHPHLEATMLRAAADLVLLTPVLLTPVLLWPWLPLLRAAAR
jgi:hypothetical protein